MTLVDFKSRTEGNVRCEWCWRMFWMSVRTCGIRAVEPDHRKSCEMPMCFECLGKHAESVHGSTIPDSGGPDD